MLRISSDFPLLFLYFRRFCEGEYETNMGDVETYKRPGQAPI
jgi:hypothetical protein